MAEYQELIYKFGADITQFKASVTQIEAAIKEVSAARKLAIGDEFVKLSNKLNDLRQSLANVNAVSLKSLDKNIGDPAKQSRIALTSLSQVAQDLPFGFIGIQNNLPVLLQSFQQLRETTKTNGGAFKELGKSLIGPSGLFFAFSAITSLITVAVQKYGSLGNAIDAIFSKNSLLIEAQNAYKKSIEESNKTIASESSQIKILIGTIGNMELPLKTRQAAYVELKKIQPDIVSGVTKEGIALASNTKIIVNQGNAYIDLLKVKIQINAVNAALDKSEVARQQAAGNVVAERNKLKLLNDQKEALKSLADQSNKTSIVVGEGIGGVMISNTGTAKTQIELLNTAITSQEEVLKNARTEYGKVNNVQEYYYNQLKPLVNKLSEYDSTAESLAENLANVNKQEKESAKYEAKKVNEDKLKYLKEYKSLLDLQRNLEKSNFKKGTPNAELIKGFNSKEYENESIKIFQSLNNKEKEDKIKNLKEYLLSYEGMYKEMEGRIIKINEASLSKLDLEKTVKKFDTSTYQESYTRAFQSLSKTALSFDPTEMTQGLDKKRLKILDDMVKKYEKARTEIEGVFFQPLQNMFETFITSGKFTFEEFSKSVLKAISQIVAKLAATAVIDLMLKLLDPTGTASAASKATGASGGLADLISGLFSSKGSMNNANIGSLSPANMTMNGSVNMVLRGSDLVGAMNRTNSQISRVG